MLPPVRKLYYHSAGEILAYHPLTGAEPIDIDVAAQLQRFHVHELLEVARYSQSSAIAFHRTRETELREAIRELSEWRRATGAWPHARQINQGEAT